MATPRWFRHARFFLGIALVVGSGAGGWWVVTRANTAEPYLVVSSDVLRGQPVHEEVLTEVFLSGPGQELGLLRPADREVLTGKVAAQDLTAGELLRLSDVEIPLPSDSTRFSLQIDVGGAEWVTRGTVVEVWVSPPTADQQFSVPYVASQAAQIVAVRTEEGFAANPALAHVDLDVPRRDLPELVHARANAFDIQLSPLPGG